MLPVNGLYGEIEWKIKPDSKETIDKVVTPGQTIASYKCILEGIPGMDVYGHEIPPKRSAQQHPETGRAVVLSKDKKCYKYRAQMLGIVNLE
ncbi:MAG: hypothetical protein HON94_09670, partial [Methylococcales bacterium]|nr:hypothetical protein [Methylococcales bacterium]